METTPSFKKGQTVAGWQVGYTGPTTPVKGDISSLLGSTCIPSTVLLFLPTALQRVPPSKDSQDV